MKRILYMLPALFILWTGSAFGQDCAESLSQAEDLYETGNFTQAIEILKNCSESENTSEQWQFNRLLAMAYLGLSEDNNAKEAVYKLMELNPTYKPNPLTDPSDLVKLIEGVTIIPKFSVGLAVSGGPNTSFPNATKGYMITDQVKKYQGLSSFQFGFSSSYQFNKNFAIELSTMSSKKSYELDYSFGNWDLQMSEKLTYINIPLMARYIPSLKTRIRPFAQLGIYTGLLIAADNSFNATYKPDESQFSLEHINSIERRNRVDFGFAGGIGASYKKGSGQFFAVMNYYSSTTKITDPDARYSNNELQQAYHYLDDEVSISNLAIGVGYSLYLNYRVLKDK